MGRLRLTGVRLGLAVCAIVRAGTGAIALAAEETPVAPIRGVAVVGDNLAMAEGARAAIRLYHPKDGVEMDVTYRIIQRPQWPLEFRVAPNVNMNGLARWPSYVIEVFTDTDGDLLSLVEGELFGVTPEPVPLGTADLVIELRPRP